MGEVRSKEICNAIVTLLNEETPLTLTEISEKIYVSKPTCLTYIRVLIEEGRVVAITSKNSRRVYYTVKKEMNSQDVNVLHEEMRKETVEAKDVYKNLEEKYEQVNSNVNSIYVNVISMMSIFVAIFSLITVNANIVFELTTQNMPDVFWGIIKINLFVVVCITILLVGVRVVIINPLLGKKNKNKEESSL